MGVTDMEKQTKYKPSMGLAFNEENEMRMLSKMAKEGWIFHSFSKLGYNFTKGKPQELIYSMDTYELKKGENEQYINLFEDAGWTHICSIENLFHFFSAVPGTKPIYTDKTTMIEKYEQGKKSVHKTAKIFGIIFLISFLLYKLLHNYWNNEIVIFLTKLISGLGLGFSIAMIITGMAFDRRIKKISQQ